MSGSPGAWVSGNYVTLCTALASHYVLTVWNLSYDLSLQPLLLPGGGGGVRVFESMKRVKEASVLIPLACPVFCQDDPKGAWARSEQRQINAAIIESLREAPPGTVLPMEVAGTGTEPNVQIAGKSQSKSSGKTSFFKVKCPELLVL